MKNCLEAADIIETELVLSDLQQAQKALDKWMRPAKCGDKEAKAVAKLQHPVRSSELAEYVADSPQVAPEEVWDDMPETVRMAA